uniref:Sut1 n=1 Tax=Escherichia coli TaxID=562 RepID=Q47657_ECOLX|nr:Sut1 [Escherichia coli]
MIQYRTLLIHPRIMSTYVEVSTPPLRGCFFYQ